MSVLVEVVACTADDAFHAVAAGAGRIELVSAISEGGLTPSVGTLLETKAVCDAPVMVMLRPRGGGFLYTDSEFRTMLRDIEALVSAGADGFVVGMLQADGSLDSQRLHELVAYANGLPFICHRAFDLTADPEDALENLIALGFSRVLTSGQAADALSGAPRLSQMRAQSRGRIEVLPGGGIRSTNVAEIARRSGADQVHLGPFRKAIDLWSGGAENRAVAEHLALDQEEVAAVVAALAGEC